MSETSQPWTILKLLGWTAEHFEKKGVDGPRLAAERLLAHVLRCDRVRLYVDYDKPLQEPELARYRDLVRRRAAREPLQHLLGRVNFCGLEIAVDARALIPRPETELLVDRVVAQLCGIANPLVADVGTGTGAIALACAKSLETARVIGFDVSNDALALARENAVRTALASRASFVESDLLSRATAPFHAIVANLPYVPSREIASLQPEVRHDPRLALDGGSDGLDLVRRLLLDAHQWLLPGGLLALELGAGQVATLISSLPAWAIGHEVIHDGAGIARHLLLFTEPDRTRQGETDDSGRCA